MAKVKVGYFNNEPEKKFRFEFTMNLNRLAMLIFLIHNFRKYQHCITTDIVTIFSVTRPDDKNHHFWRELHTGISARQSVQKQGKESENANKEEVDN